MNSFRKFLALIVCAGAAILATSTASATEFLSAEFLTRPDEMSAVFQLTSSSITVQENSPSAGKLVLSIGGLCRTSSAGGTDCPEGPIANLQPLYRFESSSPVQQLNVVDMGTGTVNLIFRLASSSLAYDVTTKGDRLQVLVGSSARDGASGRPERAAAASIDRLTAPPRAGRGSVPQEPAEATPPTNQPRKAADTLLEAPDPKYLAQDRDYRLGVGDRIEVVVHADERLNREALEIQPTGYVDLPLIGGLPVAGHTLVAVEQELERLLGESYLRDPDVTILVEEYNSQFVNVMGAVDEGGRVPLKGRTTLMDALTDVGGTTAEASGNIIIHRKGETTPTVVSLSKLQTGVEGSNILLRHGDTINVERKKPFYVSGEVRAPGKFDIEPGMTLLDALAMAGGITEYAKKKEAILIRIVDGERTRMVLDPRAIEKGKATDIEILPGDHIKVPGSYF